MALTMPPPSYYPQDLDPAPGSSLGYGISDETIENRIDTVSYSVLPGGTVTVCTVILDNGYTVWGACASSDAKTPNTELAEQCSYAEALRTLRTLFGFLATEARYLYQANAMYFGGGA